MIGFDNKTIIAKLPVTLDYFGKTATFDVEIIEKSVERISVTTLPTKKEYIQNFEDLDLTGGYITVTYNDGTKGAKFLASDGVVVSGFDNKETGTNTLTVTYLEKTATFDVEIVGKEVVEISVTKLPTKLDYEKNSKYLDLMGGVLTLKYTDDTTSTISLTDKNIGVSGFDSDKKGKNTITIKYLGLNTTFDINIGLNTIDNPKTGMRTTIYVLCILFLVTIIGCYPVYKYYKKQKYSRR